MNSWLPTIGAGAGFVIIFLIWFFTPEAKAQEVHYNPGWKPEEVRPLTIPKLKAMIRAVENSRWDFVGLKGERSSYQILEDTWRMWSLKPFSWASSYEPMCVEETERVVSKHLAYLKGQLTKQGLVQTPYLVAVCWKAGLTRFTEHRLRFEDTEYGKMALNIYEDVNK